MNEHFAQGFAEECVKRGVDAAALYKCAQMGTLLTSSGIGLGSLAGLGTAAASRGLTGQTSAGEVAGSVLGGQIGGGLTPAALAGIAKLLQDGLSPENQTELLRFAAKNPRFAKVIAGLVTAAPSALGAIAGNRIGAAISKRAAAPIPAANLILEPALYSGLISGAIGAADPNASAVESGLHGAAAGAGAGGGWAGGRALGNAIARRLGGYGNMVVIRKPGLYTNPKLAALAAVLAPLLGAAAGGVGASTLVRKVRSQRSSV